MIQAFQGKEYFYYYELGFYSFVDSFFNVYVFTGFRNSYNGFWVFL